jgi:hypothetical protein
MLSSLATKATKEAMASTLTILAGRSPGATWAARFKLAFLRAFRTLLQGIAGAFAAAGAGSSVIDASYWKSFEFAIIGAGLTAAASFLNNIAGFLPPDPTQKDPDTPTPTPTPTPPPTPPPSPEPPPPGE